MSQSATPRVQAMIGLPWLSITWNPLERDRQKWELVLAVTL